LNQVVDSLSFFFGSPTWARTKDLRINSGLPGDLTYINNLGEPGRTAANAKTPPTNLHAQSFAQSKSRADSVVSMPCKSIFLPFEVAAEEVVTGSSWYLKYSYLQCICFADTLPLSE
jgi:hypothetical protein